MSKALKWSIFALILIAIGVVLSHGIIVPRFIWEPRLQAIQNQYPDQTIQAKRVVLALSLNPQLLISEIEIDAPSRQENVKLALLRVGVNAMDSIRQGRLQIKAITVKGVYGREMFETWYKMLAMLQSGLDVSGVITHRLPVDDFQAGFDAMRSGQSGKVVLDWGRA